jgi:class 3 adenylate cyclase/predicted ATPase
MTFYEVLEQVIALLQRQERVSYRALQRQFSLDEAYIEDLKTELIEARRLAVDENGRVLVWRGEAVSTSLLPPAASPFTPQPAREDVPPPAASSPPNAERRHLTVLFCDLVDSTALASQLDPEDLRVLVRAYQETCAQVIARYEGHIAQYLGDGLLVYFGYPLAHEDDAQRAVRAGLGILGALNQLNRHLGAAHGVQLAIRLGVHTGLVVIGDMGSGTRHERLALGETPNVAARLQDLAEPNTLLVSTTTLSLLGGFFVCEPLGPLQLKGLAQPLAVYRVQSESADRSRLDVARRTGLTQLVGRAQEVGLLLERWAQVKDGLGQVVLLNGEAGIGKSRLGQVLQEQVAAESQAWLMPCQCSPYYQLTPLYPLIDLLKRMVSLSDGDESQPQRLRTLERFVIQHGLPLAEAVPLLAPLLSIPLSTAYAPLLGSPEQQRQQTLHALVTILLLMAEKQPLLFVMEDLHWVDPTTLEFLRLLVDQGPTVRILVLLTGRPDFLPPWTGRSHFTQVTLPRLPRRQVTELSTQMTHGKALPPEVLAQVAEKTDGVPLFVEELTKMVLESGLLQEREDSYELIGPLPPLAIPATLHDSLMARLDRLAPVKALAQLGSTLGREFTYALLQAVAPWDEATVRHGLQQLVEAEFLYQHGLPPQAKYRFKHALIQDAAYQSLLRSTRQQYHERIAQVLEARFPDLCATQPELLAHHYTEANLGEQAIGYWQQAGRRASERSSYEEAISHLTKGLDILQTVPETPQRTQQELVLWTTLGATLIAHKGYAAPEVEHAYARARQLCQHVGASSRLLQVLLGLHAFYLVRSELQTARDLGKECLTLAQLMDNPPRLPQAYFALGITLFFLGEFVPALQHLEQAVALYDPKRHHTRALLDTGVSSRILVAWTLWHLGYPDQALAKSHEAVTLAQGLPSPFSLAYALACAAGIHQFRREAPATYERAEAAWTLSQKYGFPHWLALATTLRGWALVVQSNREEGVAQMRQGLASWRATGAQQAVPYQLTLLADAYQQGPLVDEALTILAEALAITDRNEERFCAAEIHRLTGELLLQDTPVHQEEAEEHLQHALVLARRQQAKLPELRAAMSLARLWQRQGKRIEAHALLAEVYGWFTEGFDTADLLEAKALCDALAVDQA